MRKLFWGILLLLLLQACDNDDPAEEAIPETITEVTVSFTTDNGATTISVSAIDPDGEGPKDMEIDNPIDLTQGKTYSLRILLKNGLVMAGAPGYDVSSEVIAEGTNHMFFFGWTDDIFSDPSGNGNIDKRSDAVNYVGEHSTDANGLPLGLTTQWTTTTTPISGEFRVMLKHQPGLKTATSGSDVGETDIDVTFDIAVH